MEKIYGDLGRKTNQSKIIALKEKIETIANNPTLSSKVRLANIETEMVSAFNEAEYAYKRYRPFAKIESFINRLKNTKDKSFHYPRMLGLILKSHSDWNADHSSESYLLFKSLEAKIKDLVPHESYPNFAHYTHPSIGADKAKPQIKYEPFIEELSKEELDKQNHTIKNIYNFLCNNYSKIINFSASTTFLSDLERVSKGEKPVKIYSDSADPSLSVGYTGAIKVVERELYNQMLLLNVDMRKDYKWLNDAWTKTQDKLMDPNCKNEYAIMLGRLLNYLCEANKEPLRLPKLGSDITPPKIVDKITDSPTRKRKNIKFADDLEPTKEPTAGDKKDPLVNPPSPKSILKKK